MAEKNRATIILEFVPVYILAKIVWIMPFGLTRLIGRFLGRIAFLFVRSRTKLARKNLQLVFSEIEGREIENIVKKCWESIGQTALEFVKIPNLTKEKFLSIVDIEGREYLDRGLRQGNGVILALTHFGNWEMMGLILACLGYHPAVIVRPLDNPLIDKLVNGLRDRWGTKIIAKRRATSGSIRHLKENGTIGILIDQYLPGGIESNFFGYPSKMTSIIPLLAKKTNAEVLWISDIRDKKGFKIFIRPIEGFAQLLSDDDYVLKGIDLLNNVAESWIRRYPHYWFWVHKKWRMNQ